MLLPFLLLLHLPTGRASQNVEFVKTVAELPVMVFSVGAKTNTLVLVERFLGGREFCIAVMGAGPAGASAFSPVERHLERDEKVGAGGGWVIGEGQRYVLLASLCSSLAEGIVSYQSYLDFHVLNCVVLHCDSDVVVHRGVHTSLCA